MEKGSFTLVENRHAAAGEGHDLHGNEAYVDGIHAVRQHVAEREAAQVAGASADAARRVLGHTLRGECGYKLRVVIVEQPHVTDL